MKVSLKKEIEALVLWLKGCCEVLGIDLKAILAFPYF
jgi:hypothetical protein